MIPTRHTEDLLLGMRELLQQLGRVPRRLIWDNESGIGRGKRHAEGVGAFTGTLATTASGAQLRIRAAGFAARKTLEEFDWDGQSAVRQQIAATD